MAFASILTTAIGIILLIITAYVLVGGTLTATQTALTTQADMTAVHVKMLGTSIEIVSTNVSSSDTLYISVLNSGSESITDLSHVDVLVLGDSGAPVLYVKDSGWSKVSISPDTIYPNQWDPGEVMNMSVTYSSGVPKWVKVTTGNGAYASSYV